MISESIFRRIDREISIRHLSLNTGKTYKIQWEHIRQFFPETDHPKNLSDNHLKDFIAFVNDNVSPSSARLALNAARFYYTNVEGMPNKLSDVKIKRIAPKIIEIVPHETIMKIINKCENPQDRAIISIFYSTGLRREELMKLERDCIDIEQQIIRIKYGKGGKQRIVPLRPEIIAIIGLHLASLPAHKKFSRWLFPGTKKDHYISKSMPARAIDRNFTEKHIHPHLLRHSYGTWLYEQGVQLKSIADLFGHASTKPTERYVHTTPKFLLQLPNPMDRKVA